MRRILLLLLIVVLFLLVSYGTMFITVASLIAGWTPIINLLGG